MEFRFHQSHSLPLEAMHGGQFHSSAFVKKERKKIKKEKMQMRRRRRKQRGEQLHAHVASLPADPPHA